MDLPISFSKPITDFDVKKLHQLNWEWICWLRTLRQKLENGESLNDGILMESAIEYFSKFQRKDGFINLSDSYAMPSDARVDFIYIPTVVACSIVNLLGSTNRQPQAERFLKKTLPATAGRNFRGSGYDGSKYMAFFIELFAWGNLLPTLINSELTNLSFHKTLFNCYRDFTQEVLNPKEKRSWGDINTTWASHCLQLMNSECNNWPLLQSSPIWPEFARLFEYRDLVTTMNSGQENE
ncbi:hypothetical protein [Microbulbifer guangxiensis]|uniref:hypothetical protein n=1 Tax=Microbulbifer guangxiensis TaxID=2904249 RepID=UPI001F376E4E|nr:hypothetical protein [Microbulbifer guangxiensis]